MAIVRCHDQLTNKLSKTKHNKHIEMTTGPLQITENNSITPIDRVNLVREVKS